MSVAIKKRLDTLEKAAVEFADTLGVVLQGQEGIAKTQAEIRQELTLLRKSQEEMVGGLRFLAPHLFKEEPFTPSKDAAEAPKQTSLTPKPKTSENDLAATVKKIHPFLEVFDVEGKQCVRATDWLADESGESIFSQVSAEVKALGFKLITRGNWRLAYWEPKE